MEGDERLDQLEHLDGQSNPEPKADLFLRESEALLYPLAKLLISQGVGYPQLASRLKQVFVEAAQHALEAESSKPTDAAISVRSGVHRKDVRVWRENKESQTQELHRKELSTADQVYTKWLTDAAYKASDGKPRSIALTGPAPSFDALVLSITKDFHRRTVLDELVRLGLVRESDDVVEPLAEALVPSQDVANMLEFFRSNVGDHLSAGVANLLASKAGAMPAFLERSVFAQGLSAQSVEQLSVLAKQLWQPAFQQMVAAASQQYAVDKDVVAPHEKQRMRFGVYFYSEPSE